MSLHNSHPLLKNRRNKYMDNLDEVKTWVDMESSEPNMIVEPARIGLASSHNRDNINIYTAASEKELEGLYCTDPTFIYLNADENHKFFSCKNIVWNCNKCEVDLKRRRLDRMNKMIDKFDHHSGIDRSDLYHLIIRDYTKQDLTAAKITKRLKYLCIDNLLMYTINEETDTITYLLNGHLNWVHPLDIDNDNIGFEYTDVKISFDYAINHIGLDDKYAFLGKFFKKIPSVKIRGMTQQELDELEEQEHFKNDYCKCGEAWSDHTRRKASPALMIDVIQPMEHYVEGHKKFLMDQFGIK